jgi:hypothetical protein
LTNDAGGASSTCQGKVCVCNTKLSPVPGAARVLLKRMAKPITKSNAIAATTAFGSSLPITLIKVAALKSDP